MPYIEKMKKKNKDQNILLFINTKASLTKVTFFVSMCFTQLILKIQICFSKCIDEYIICSVYDNSKEKCITHFPKVFVVFDIQSVSMNNNFSMCLQIFLLVFFCFSVMLFTTIIIWIINHVKLRVVIQRASCFFLFFFYRSKTLYALNAILFCKCKCSQSFIYLI